MNKVQFSQEELKEILDNNTFFSIGFKLNVGSLSEDFIIIDETSYLDPKKIKRILQTFPPVWEIKLTGFSIALSEEDEEVYEMFMLVKHDKGYITYKLGNVDLDLKFSKITIKEKL